MPDLGGKEEGVLSSDRHKLDRRNAVFSRTAPEWYWPYQGLVSVFMIFEKMQQAASYNF